LNIRANIFCPRAKVQIPLFAADDENTKGQENTAKLLSVVLGQPIWIRPNGNSLNKNICGFIFPDGRQFQSKVAPELKPSPLTAAGRPELGPIVKCTVSVSSSKELNTLLDEMFADTSGTVMPKTTYVQQFIDAVTPGSQTDGSN
jgi:hypothetical protein